MMEDESEELRVHLDLMNEAGGAVGPALQGHDLRRRLPLGQEAGG